MASYTPDQPAPEAVWGDPRVDLLDSPADVLDVEPGSTVTRNYRITIPSQASPTSPGGRGETARGQLTPATHGLLPVDQPLVRRGETRAAQRKIDGRPVPVGLAGLKAARLDKGLTRGYLDGRFGGIPAAGKAGSRGQKEGQPPQAQDLRPRASCRMPGECRGADRGGCR